MQKKAALISAIASALLTGCGGGGDSDTAQQASNTPAPAPASSPTPSPTPSSSPSPSPDPASSPSPTPVGEALPNLADPQLGSTAATGTGPVGVWSANSGLGRALAFIDPSLNIYSLNSSAFRTDRFHFNIRRFVVDGVGKAVLSGVCVPGEFWKRDICTRANVLGHISGERNDPEHSLGLRRSERIECDPKQRHRNVVANERIAHD